MKSEYMPLDRINVPDRFRKDYGDIEALKTSLTTYGLIQPIVLDATNTLVAGGRRLQAAKQLGWIAIPAVFQAELSEAQRRELELEENVRRMDMHWTERCVAVAEIHQLHSMDAARTGEPWGYDQTGELLGIAARSNIYYALTLASLIKAGDKEVLACAGPRQALELLAQRKLAEASIVYASRTTENLVTGAVISSQSEPTLSPLVTPRGVIKLVYGDALAWTCAQPDASIDCVYTDPPYGIDMDNLQQEGGGMRVELVEKTHQVADNLRLIQSFIEAVTPKMRDSAFLVLWTDYVHLDWLSQLAPRVGLRFQRWPLVWVKTSVCQNLAAYSNFTKATEVAVVLSKPKAVLAAPAATNYFVCSADKAEYAPTNPFWKPLALHTWVLLHIAPKTATIVDPFCGSGSILMAAVAAGHNCIGVEMDPVHYADACRRLNVV